MSAYQCPVCHKEVPRDLVVFLDHAKQHIIDEIKKQHPEWVENSGVCKQCMMYYEEQLGGKSC